MIASDTNGDGGPERARLGALATLIAERFGLSIKSYPAVLLRQLLSRLPDTIDADNAATSAQIIDALSIGETSFLRHPAQLSALREVLPSLPACQRGEPLQVWSAGCATGEEAYSLAATLVPAWRPGVRVLGTDLSEKAIERARKGGYTRWSLRDVDLSTASGWLEVTREGAVVRPHLLQHVELRAMNLMEGPYPQELDVIFCRNVLLYFQADAARRVLERMAASMRPGGVIMLSPTDPSPPLPLSCREERQGDVRFVRIIERSIAPAAVPALASALAPALAPVPTPAAAPSSGTPPRSPRAPERDDASAFDLEEHLRVARALASQRDFAAALDVLAVTREARPLAVEPNVLAAMVAEEAGMESAAIEAARRACFLEPHAPALQLLLGCCFHRAKQPRRARAHFKLAKDGLARVANPALPLPFSEGLTAHQLRRLIDAYLDITK